MQKKNQSGLLDVPFGWNFNPSAWSHRVPVLLLSVLGVLIATYLFLYQLNILFHTVWEPFFGNGSKTILHSSISRLLPFPDAGLGIAGYLADLVFGFSGDEKRWKTKPYMVFLFTITFCSLGFGSIFLAIAQPVFYNSWCTLCLCSAFISVLIVGPSLPETLASLQYLKYVKKSGHSVWHALLGKSINQ